MVEEVQKLRDHLLVMLVKVWVEQNAGRRAGGGGKGGGRGVGANAGAKVKAKGCGTVGRGGAGMCSEV